VKEARLQQGNVKLVDAHRQHPVDLLDPNVDTVAPRIVLVANRERTRAVAETQDWESLIAVDEMTEKTEDGSAAQSDLKRRSALGNVVLARWSKRKTALSRLSTKLSQWARSIRKYGCASEDNTNLDRFANPHGRGSSNKASVSKNDTLKPCKTQVAQRDVSDSSEDGARYLL